MNKTKKKVISHTAWILGILLALHFLLLTRVTFTAWPEMLLWPYLMLKGWLPYQDIAIAHTPLMLVDLSIFYKLFGVGLTQLKVYTWLTVLMIDVLIFKIVSEFWSKKAASLALLFFIPIHVFYDGNGLWFDLSVALLGLLLYYLAKRKEYLWTGVLIVLAFFVKQTAFWFVFPLFITIFSNAEVGKLRRAIVRVIKGALFALSVFTFALIVYGVLNDFLFWAFEFGSATLPLSPGQINFPSLRQLILALLPFTLLIFLPKVTGLKNSLEVWFWAFFGILGAFPRWELFHFQPALPFLAMGIGLIAADIKKFKKYLIALVTLVIVVNIYLVGRNIARKWGDSTRFFETDTLETARFIRDSTQPNEYVFILNAWDHIYALSETLPATKPWLPHLPWYMSPKPIQENIVKDLRENSPKYIVMCSFTDTGLGSFKPELIVSFIDDNYVVEKEVGAYKILIGNK